MAKCDAPECPRAAERQVKLTKAVGTLAPGVRGIQGEFLSLCGQHAAEAFGSSPEALFDRLRALRTQQHEDAVRASYELAMGQEVGDVAQGTEHPGDAQGGVVGQLVRPRD